MATLNSLPFKYRKDGRVGNSGLNVAYCWDGVRWSWKLNYLSDFLFIATILVLGSSVRAMANDVKDIDKLWQINFLKTIVKC